MSTYENDAAYAARMDESDPLRRFRESFIFPKGPDGEDVVYLAGNSLGLQPRRVRENLEEELDAWSRFGVEAHFKARHPWMPYHELLTEQTARLVGAKPLEVVVMNTLSVNLHLMMVSFYRPSGTRERILMEAGAFPSDQYAVASQVRFHGRNPDEAISLLRPRAGEETLRPEDVLARIDEEGNRLALVMLGNPNYRTGQAFDLKAISEAAHRVGANVGFDCAHGAGNLRLELHESGCDFAVWCSYKYLNGGPGTLGGVFVHERHARSAELPRFAGWWGHDKASRFTMPEDFRPIPGAEGWQLSNPPIFQLAALRASMDLFDEAGIAALREKSERLTGYLEFLLGTLPEGACTQLTPRDPRQRGAQLSLRFAGGSRKLVDRLAEEGIICDFREPDVIRAAPAPMYCSYADVFRFVSSLRKLLGRSSDAE